MRCSLSSGSPVLLLFVLCAVLATDCQVARAQPPQPVMLSAAIVPDDPNTHPPQPLTIGRELARQSFLIAARDEFGLPTRDMVLGEHVDPESPRHFQPQVFSFTPKNISVSLLHQGKTISSETYADVGVALPQILRQLAWEETRSRTVHVETLRALGEVPKRRPQGSMQKVAPEVELSLTRMNDVSQFAAVRRLHGDLAEFGDSEELLSGLARGYAHLAYLTQPVIDTRFWVYRARSWLYSQRLIALYPNSAIGYRTRAYVMSWATAYNQTELDLGTATRLATSPAVTPNWARLAGLAALSDYTQLKQQAEDPNNPDREIAAVMMFRAVLSSRSSELVILAADAAIQVAPATLSVAHGAFTRASASKARTLSSQMSLHQRASVSQHVAEVPGLPSDVLALMTGRPMDARRVDEIGRALDVAGRNDSMEPSWAVLGENLRSWNYELLFLHAYYSINIMGMGDNRFIREHADIFRDHPYEPIFRALEFFPEGNLEQVSRVPTPVPLFEINGHSLSYSLFRGFGQAMKFGNVSGSRLMFNGEPMLGIFEDALIARMILQSPEWANEMGYQLEMTARNSCLTLRYRMKNPDRRPTPADVAPLEAQAIRNPESLYFLARARGILQDLPARANLLKQYVAMIPEPQAWAELAYVLYTDGSDAEFLEAAEKVIELPDPRGFQAEFSRYIAGTLMRDGRYNAALPWAERAAASGMGWGMYSLSNCLTLQGDFTGAEEIEMKVSRRFQSNDWLMWCLETGQGDIEKAFGSLIEMRVSEPSAVHVNYILNDPLFLLAKGELIAAENLLRDSPRCKILAGLLADRRSDSTSRDRLWKELTIDPDASQAHGGRVALVKAFLEHPDDSGALLAAVGKIPRGQGTLPAEIELYLGFYFETRGLRQLAQNQYTLAAREADRNCFRALACHWLRKLDVDPIHLPGRNFDGQILKPSQLKTP